MFQQTIYKDFPIRLQLQNFFFISLSFNEQNRSNSSFWIQFIFIMIISGGIFLSIQMFTMMIVLNLTELDFFSVLNNNSLNLVLIFFFISQFWIVWFSIYSCCFGRIILHSLQFWTNFRWIIIIAYNHEFHFILNVKWEISFFFLLIALRRKCRQIWTTHHHSFQSNKVNILEMDRLYESVLNLEKHVCFPWIMWFIFPTIKKIKQRRHEKEFMRMMMMMMIISVDYLKWMDENIHIHSTWMK